MQLTPEQNPIWFLNPQKTPLKTAINIALNAASDDPAWLQNLIKCINPNLQFLHQSIGSKINFYADFEKNIEKHIGKTSTYPYKDDLIYNLKIIYAFFTRKCAEITLSVKDLYSLQRKLLESCAHDSRVFYNTTHEIIQFIKSLAPPAASIGQLLMEVRSKLVRNAIGTLGEKLIAEKVINSDWLLSHRTAFIKHFMTIANELGYNVDDEHLSLSDSSFPEPHFREQIAAELKRVFQNNYTFFNIFKLFDQYLINALNRMNAPEILPSGETSKITIDQLYAKELAYLNQLCGLKLEQQDYRILEFGYPSQQLDWPGLHRKLWLKMVNEGYFVPVRIKEEKSSVIATIAHAVFFELLDPATQPSAVRHEDIKSSKPGKEFAKSLSDRVIIAKTLFSIPEDAIHCIDVFDLGEDAQRTLLLDYALPFLQTSYKKDPSTLLQARNRLLLQAAKSPSKDELLSRIFLLFKAERWKIDCELFWHDAVESNNPLALQRLKLSLFSKEYEAWRHSENHPTKDLITLIRKHAFNVLRWALNERFYKKNHMNATDPSGNTPLHYAVNYGALEAVKLLLLSGADCGRPNNSGQLPINFSRNPEINSVINIHVTEQALCLKLAFGEFTGVASTPVRLDYLGLKYADQTPLMAAAKYGRIETVKQLIAQGVPAHPENHNQESALLQAAQNGHFSIVNLLLPFTKKLRQLTKALLIATQHGHIEIVEKLCAALIEQDEILESDVLIREAAKSNQTGIIKFFLSKYHEFFAWTIESPDSADDEDEEDDESEKEDPILLIAIKNANVEMVNLLIEMGCHLRVSNKKDTALSLAVRLKQTAIVSSLLAAGAEDEDAEAFEIAVQQQNFAVVKQLIDHHVYPPAPPETADEDFNAQVFSLQLEVSHKSNKVFAAIEAGEKDIDLSDVPVNACNDRGQSLLMLATIKGRVDLVVELLARKANTVKECQKGWNVWMYAANAGQLEIIRHLAKTKISSEDFYALLNYPLLASPVVIALINGHYQVVRELIILGANISHRLKSLEQQTVIEFILRNYQPPATASIDHQLGSLGQLTMLEYLLKNHKPDGLAFLIDICLEQPKLVKSIFNPQVLTFTNASDESIEQALNSRPEGKKILELLEKSADIHPIPLPITTSTPDAPSHPSYLPLPSLEPIRPLSPVIPTSGNGNCAFHAIWGTWDHHHHQLTDAEHLIHRQQLSEAVLTTNPTTHPQRYRLIQESILAIIHEESTKIALGQTLRFKADSNPQLLGLLEKYQASSVEAEQAWNSFKDKVVANPAVMTFIDEQCSTYVSKQTGKKLTAFQDKYIHMNNTCKEAFKELLEKENLLADYNYYQALLSDDPQSQIDQLAINADHIKEYAKLLNTNGQTLLGQEIALIADVFNKTVVYYLRTPRNTTLLNATFNAGCSETVHIRHNGIHHFERMAPHAIIAQPAEIKEAKHAVSPDSQCSPVTDKPLSPSSAAGSSTSSSFFAGSTSPTAKPSSNGRKKRDREEEQEVLAHQPKKSKEEDNSSPITTTAEDAGFKPS